MDHTFAGFRAKDSKLLSKLVAADEEEIQPVETQEEKSAEPSNVLEFEEERAQDVEAAVARAERAVVSESDPRHIVLFRKCVEFVQLIRLSSRVNVMRYVSRTQGGRVVSELPSRSDFCCDVELAGRAVLSREQHLLFVAILDGRFKFENLPVKQQQIFHDKVGHELARRIGSLHQYFHVSCALQRAAQRQRADEDGKHKAHLDHLATRRSQRIARDTRKIAA